VPSAAFSPRVCWLLSGLLLLGSLSASRARAQTGSPPRPGPPVRVSGTVSETASQQPIPGASVRVQRTRRGTATDAQGNFRLTALPTDTLLFRAIGYRPYRRLLGGTGLAQLVVRVRLVRDSVALGEVRVTADRPDRAQINRALRNLKRPAAVAKIPVRPAAPRPLFPVDTLPPALPKPTIGNPTSFIYEKLSRAGKERRKMAAIRAAERAEKARQARARYNRAFKDNRGYE